MSNPPNAQQFYESAPLYDAVVFPEGHDRLATNVVYGEGPLDIFCPWCGQHSIFKRYINGVSHTHITQWVGAGSFMRKFHCSRVHSHTLEFWVEVDGEDRTVTKVGQSPALAELCLYDVRKYGAVLDKNMFRELTKAIGLAAHGVGIGSFVYLRRIFEFLVEEAHVKAVQVAGWDDESYLRERMDDKIKLLRGHLPEFLVDNRVIYGILSKGIHELSENECLAAFPAVKMGIEIILDQKLRADEDERKIKEAMVAIQLASSKLK